MSLNILGWKCEGLRCPDFNVELEKHNNSSTFFQMPNGTGKTTTLRLLKRSLYNHEFKSSEIDEFKAKKKEEYKKNGFFEAKFSINGKIFYTKINFDFENKVANYSSSLTDDGGYVPGFKLPKEIENIIDKELVDLLLVDLEIDVKPMFRESQTRAQEAIKKFCKINLLDSLINDFQQYKNKKRKESSQSGNIQSRINTEEARLKKIENKISDIELKRDEFKKFLNDTEEEYLSGKKQLDEVLEKDSQIKKKIKDLEIKRDKIKADYEGILLENFENIKNIGTYDNNLKSEVKDFVTNLDEMGLPEEEVRIFFDKILKKADCICGEKLTDEKKK